MTNSDQEELQIIQDKFGSVVSYIQSGRRCKRCRYSLFDVMFMGLAVYKNGGAWDSLASMCKLITFTFQRMILKYVGAVETRTDQKEANKKEIYFTLKRQQQKVF